MKLKRLSISILLMALTAWGQYDPMQNNFRGIPISGAVVSGGDLLELVTLRAQLLDVASRRVLAESPVGVKGSFQLPAVPTGFYEFRIVGQAGDVRYTQEFHSGTAGFLEVRLSSTRQPGIKNSISAIRLMHNTPKGATKELEAATKAFQKGNRAKAIEHLEKAAALDPENFDATSNLGALYLQEHERTKAFEWLERAHRIDPGDSVNNVNLSAYYANEGQFDKAEEHALKGLKQDPTSVRGRYMLAVALVRQGKDVEHARSYLNEIQNQFSPARNLLQSLLPRQ